MEKVLHDRGEVVAVRGIQTDHVRCLMGPEVKEKVVEDLVEGGHVACRHWAVDQVVLLYCIRK
jgi:hypothetical protein